MSSTRTFREAFKKNQILILVNDRQVESLDEEIEVGTDTTVSFLRLTLLVGGLTPESDFGLLVGPAAQWSLHPQCHQLVPILGRVKKPRL